MLSLQYFSFKSKQKIYVCLKKLHTQVLSFFDVITIYIYDKLYFRYLYVVKEKKIDFSNCLKQLTKKNKTKKFTFNLRLNFYKKELNYWLSQLFKIIKQSTTENNIDQGRVLTDFPGPVHPLKKINKINYHQKVFLIRIFIYVNRNISG